jgi:hypothetical protein
MTSDGQEPTRNSCLMSGRRQEALDLAVELLMGVGHAGQIALFEDRGAEAGLGEDHHARGGLQEVRAGARAHHQEERVLHLAVQPDDAGEAAEDLPLAALFQDRGVLAASALTDMCRTVHAAPSASRRATRSFHRN